MAKNFKSNGIVTKRLIADDHSNTILVYGQNIVDQSSDNGAVTDQNLLNKVGSDVFLFVSGSKNSKNSGSPGLALFGGDVVVSGTLYAERQVIEVDETVPGTLLVSGSLQVSGSSVFNVNKDQGADFLVKSSNKDYAIKVDSFSNTIQFMSGGSPLSPDESTYSDTNYFVSGSIGSAVQPQLGQAGNGDRGTGVFGGDLVVSGSLWANGVNITNNNGGQVISLKGYVENGLFETTSVVSGQDSISLGTNNLIESDNSFILGSKNNRIEGENYLNNTIVGSLGSIISGSNNSLIIGGNDNSILSTSPAYAAFSDRVRINNAEVLALYSDNLFASGTIEKTIIIGANNRLEGSQESRLEKSFIYGEDNNIKEIKNSLVFNLIDNESYNPGNNTTTENNVTGSNYSLIFSNGNQNISGSNRSFIYSSDSTINSVERNILLGRTNTIEAVEDSFVNVSSSHISDLNKSIILSNNNLTVTHDEVTDLNNHLQSKGVVDYTATKGLNTIIGGEYLQISGSYNSTLGANSSIISGSNSSIINSINSKIYSTGSVIIGGISNLINSNESFIIGTQNTVNGNSNLIFGNNITSNLDNSIILGSGNDPENYRLIVSASDFRFGDLSSQKLYGDDVNFYVSGSIGARDRFLNGETNKDLIHGVAVFGGDLHVSGNLSGGNFELDNVFFDGGDSKGRDRTLGNNDAYDISFLTNGMERINIEGSTGRVNIGGLNGPNGSESNQVHIRTGSIGNYQFESSKDLSPAKNYPLLISRNVQQQIDEQNPLVVTEVGLAFTSYPTLDQNNINQGTNEEPGAAITHKIKGRNTGDLLFKTKTSEGQISLGDDPSLTTKLIITNEGEMLLGNENPDGYYIDLRVSGSDFPLFQATGSNLTNRLVSIASDTAGTGLLQSDTLFYVNGSPGGKASNPSVRTVSSFGGDVVVSGTLYVEQDIDVTGSLLIQGDITSKDDDLNITAPQNITQTAQNNINLNAQNDVTVSNDLVVTNNITGSHIKGDGLEVSNVNKSSTWVKDQNNNLVIGDIIDGNTGLFVLDLGAMLNKINQNTGDARTVYYPTTNTRLYDTYYEIEKNNIGQVQALSNGNLVSKSIETERVESPEHLIIVAK